MAATTPAATAEEQRERELKFDVRADWSLPDLSRLLPPGGSIEQQSVRLESTYYDTESRDLLRTGLTLRRRTGDTDEGWHLKVPDGDARLEIRLPLGGRGVPAQLRDATTGLRGRAALRPIATLRTEREIHRLLTADGTPLAEVVVDAVSAAQLLEFGVTRSWREVEVELQVAGDEDLLARAARRLIKSGAERSASGSKLGRALDTPVPPARDLTRLAGLVGHYLDIQYAAVVGSDIALRRGHNAVHPMRLAVRRYRSVLRDLAPPLDPERAVALEAELTWLGGLLGAVRDRQVLRGHLAAAFAELPPELAAGPTAAEVDAVLGDEQATAETALTAAMRGARYVRLLAELRDWRYQLPVADAEPAVAVEAVLGRARRRVARRGGQVPAAVGADRDDAVHRVRKAAKRARYLAELAEPELGRRARRVIIDLTRRQDELGARQDRVIAAAFLRDLATGAGRPALAGGAFALGVLYERERADLDGSGRP